MVRGVKIRWYRQWWAVTIFCVMIFVALLLISFFINGNKTITGRLVSEEKTLADYQVGELSRYYSWNYKDKDYSLSINLYPEVYKFFKNRDRTRDYDLFASDYHSKNFIRKIDNELLNYANSNSLSKDEMPQFILSFVQNLPYTSDVVTTGFDEYPRYPYETFYDNGGDCEDTSILASAMLKELGYDSVLLKSSNHMAVGIKCSQTDGKLFFSYSGNNYCYSETTGKDWSIGQLPPELDGSNFVVEPIIERPALDINFKSSYKYNEKGLDVETDLTVKNLGSEIANGAKIDVFIQSRGSKGDLAKITSDPVSITPEETYNYHTSLHSESGYEFRVYAKVYGDNLVSDEAFSEWIDTK